MLYSSVQVMEVHLRGLWVSESSENCFYNLSPAFRVTFACHCQFTKKKRKSQDCQLNGTGSIFDKILICSPSRGPDGHVGGQVVTGMLISPREAVNVFYQNKSLLVGAAEGHLPKEARRSRPPVSHHREPGR